MQERGKLEGKPRGGTELLVEGLHRHVPKDLLNKVHISVSVPQSGVRHLKPFILFEHQSYDQPSVQCLTDERILAVIDKIVFVSQWQREKYNEHFRIPEEKTTVIHNAIEPIPQHTKPHSPLRLIYTSMPFRGLDVLLDAFELLSNRPALFKVNRADLLEPELHIYSGMGLYGSARALEDARFESLYAKARSMRNVLYHGVVPNEEIRKALQEAHIFAYPNTWEETSCLSLIEALSAGCLAIAPELGALPETASGFAQLYQYTENTKEHAERFAQELAKAIDTFWDKQTQQRLKEQKDFFDNTYSWEKRGSEWTVLLQKVIDAQRHTL